MLSRFLQAVRRLPPRELSDVGSFCSSPSGFWFLELRGVRRAEAADRGIDRVAQPLDDGVDLLRVDDERRRDQRMIAARAVDRAARRVDHEAARHSLALHPRIKLEFRIEWRFRRAVFDELDCPEQATATDVANMA